MVPKDNQDLIKIQQAHDRLFRESMQDIDVARKLSSLTLPSRIQNRFVWETLEIVKENWLNENLREYRSDVIYRAKIPGDDQWVYLLFEHKSTPDKRIHFQLLNYIVKIWQQHEMENGAGGLLPQVIPIVICHSGRPCKSEETVPDFHFLMLDLWFFDPEQMEDGSPMEKGTGKLKMLLLALKHSRSPGILSVLPQIIRISMKVEGKECDYLRVIIFYLSSVIDGGLMDRFKEIVVREHKDGEAIMATIADKFSEKERLEKERIERELKKEIEQKDSVIEQKEELMHQVIRRMAQKEMSMQSIQEITGFDSETIGKIIQNT